MNESSLKLNFAPKTAFVCVCDCQTGGTGGLVMVIGEWWRCQVAMWFLSIICSIRQKWSTSVVIFFAFGRRGRRKNTPFECNVSGILFISHILFARSHRPNCFSVYLIVTNVTQTHGHTSTRTDIDAITKTQWELRRARNNIKNANVKYFE